MMLQSVENLRETVFAFNRTSGRFEDAVWVVGDGRSGTTWLAEALQRASGFRTVFEPFHPRYVPPMRGYPLFHYLSPEQEDGHLEAFARDVFTGRFLLPRSNAGNRRLLYNGLLIKDIFSHLFLAWADSRFPDVRKVLLLRHPFAVALSKRRLHKRDWVWMTEPAELLDRDALVEDHLGPFEDVIRGATGFFEKQVVLWAIAHYVPFRQLSTEQVHVVFYEEMCADPVKVTNDVLELLGREAIQGRKKQRLRHRLQRPSSTSASFPGNRDLVGWWREELDSNQIVRGIEILDRFGLADVYHESTLPDRGAVQRLLRTSS